MFRFCKVANEKTIANKMVKGWNALITSKREQWKEVINKASINNVSPNLTTLFDNLRLIIDEITFRKGVDVHALGIHACKSKKDIQEAKEYLDENLHENFDGVIKEIISDVNNRLASVGAPPTAINQYLPRFSSHCTLRRHEYIGQIYSLVIQKESMIETHNFSRWTRGLTIGIAVLTLLVTFFGNFKGCLINDKALRGSNQSNNSATGDRQDKNKGK